MNARMGIVLAAFLVNAAVYGQGTILFDTFVPGQVDAPVSAFRADIPVGGLNPPGSVKAQLFMMNGGAYAALSPVTSFPYGTGMASFYVDPVRVPVPAVAPGSTVTVVMRVWHMGTSYDDPINAGRGESNAIEVRLGGMPPGAGEVIPDGLLVGMRGFTIVPEPGTVTVGLLGAAVLLARCRRQRGSGDVH